MINILYEYRFNNMTRSFKIRWQNRQCLNLKTDGQQIPIVWSYILGKMEWLTETRPCLCWKIFPWKGGFIPSSQIHNRAVKIRHVQQEQFTL